MASPRPQRHTFVPPPAALAAEPIPGKRTQVESWTLEQTTLALASTSLGSAPPLSIPLDATPSTPAHLRFAPTGAHADPPPRGAHTVHRRSMPIRRDSQARREALLRGQAGSRRRQRWENDRLLGVPGAVPPEPQDWSVPAWEVRGEYKPVPYWLAPLWDGKYKASLEERERGERRKEGDGVEQGVVRDLKRRIRKSRGAKGLLQDLEEEVRRFLEEVERMQREEGENAVDSESEEDEEIVFVGRNGDVVDAASVRGEGRGLAGIRRESLERLIFESAERDHGAAFGRWLVHSIADYYGLDTWSVTTGNPARREAYVGFKSAQPDALSLSELPRPLWVSV